MPILTITWGTSLNPCPICSALNGHQWTYISGARTPPKTLTAHGRQVWDLAADHSTAHGLQRFNCRCALHAKIDLSDLYRFAKTLREALT